MHASPWLLSEPIFPKQLQRNSNNEKPQPSVVSSFTLKPTTPVIRLNRYVGPINGFSQVHTDVLLAKRHWDITAFQKKKKSHKIHYYCITY